MSFQMRIVVRRLQLTPCGKSSSYDCECAVDVEYDEPRPFQVGVVISGHGQWVNGRFLRL